MTDAELAASWQEPRDAGDGERPHSSLNDLTPEEFRDAHASGKFTGSVSVKTKNPVSL
jgi:hypothetical protein